MIQSEVKLHIPNWLEMISHIPSLREDCFQLSETTKFYEMSRSRKMYKQLRTTNIHNTSHDLLTRQLKLYVNREQNNRSFTWLS